MTNTDQLYDYYLHFNIYTKYWNAVKRSQSNDYLNGTLAEDKILKHKNVTDLIRYITQHG